MIVTHVHPDGRRTHDIVLDVDDDVYDVIRQRAAANGRSVSDEARTMIETRLGDGSDPHR